MEKLNGENVRSDFLNHFKWQRVNIIVKIIMASNCQLNNFFIQPPAFYKNSQNNTKYEFKSLVVYRFILPVLFFCFLLCLLVTGICFYCFITIFQLYARKLVWINNCVYLYCQNIIGEPGQSRSWQIIYLTTFILWKVNMKLAFTSALVIAWASAK